MQLLRVNSSYVCDKIIIFSLTLLEREGTDARRVQGLRPQVFVVCLFCLLPDKAGARGGDCLRLRYFVCLLLWDCPFWINSSYLQNIQLVNIFV